MVTRRQVLVAGGAVAAGGALAACGGGSGAAPATRPSAGTVVAAVADVPVGGGVINPDAAVVVVQPEQGDISAFSAVCPHQRCLVSSVADNQIHCACHGSVFSALDGGVTAGPAMTGLEQVTVAVEGDSVVLA